MIIIIKFHHETSSTRHVKMFPIELSAPPLEKVSIWRTLVAVRNHTRKLAYRAMKVRRRQDRDDTRNETSALPPHKYVIWSMYKYMMYIRYHIHSHKAHTLDRVVASTKGLRQYSFKMESNERASERASQPAQEGQRGSKSESRRVTVGDPAAGCRQHSYNTTQTHILCTNTHHATDAVSFLQIFKLFYG